MVVQDRGDVVKDYLRVLVVAFLTQFWVRGINERVVLAVLLDKLVDVVDRGLLFHLLL